MATVRLPTFSICALLSALAFSSASDEDADSGAFLQTSIGREPTSSWNCPLPEDAKWCSVNVPGTKSFQMAVYVSQDIVSKQICDQGVWEDLHPEDLGARGHAIDIGGNIGYHTFVLANAGWNVTTFEPMAKNVQLMQATLCRNPVMKPRIDIHQVGLGASDDVCQIMSDTINVGDGITRCGEDAKKAVPVHYEIRQSFDVRRLDDMLIPEAVPTVDYVKLDVEGFECQVLAGGSKLFDVYKPRLLHTEVWSEMHGCDPGSYIEMFLKNGYKVASDVACMKPDMDGPRGPRGKISTKDFWICKKSSLIQQSSVTIPPAHKRRVLFKSDS